MSLCPYAYLELSLSGLLTASDQGSLTTFGELFNISALDPLLPTLLITTLCLCALLTILYYSLVVAWEVFWASRRSLSPLDPSAEVVLTAIKRVGRRGSRAETLSNSPIVIKDPYSDTVKELLRDNSKISIGHKDMVTPTDLRDNSKTLG